MNITETVNDKSFTAPQLLPLETTPIIVHCHLRWDFVWQRPQQIFSRLASQHRILFIEDPMLEEGEAHLKITEPYPNIVRVLPILPHEDNISINDQHEKILALLHKELKEHPLLAGQFDSPIQWFYSPMTAPSFLGQFDQVSVVYDCMDELAQFRFAPPDIAQREQFLLSKADVVFTGGYQLFESKSRYHDNVHFYGCGVDTKHYSKARSTETVIPSEVANLPRPIFGYFGVIDERLDYDLLEHLAESFPEASVVMVGPLAKVEAEQLPKSPNIYWLGSKSYEDLPALVKSFDVCLMPFALNEATQYINPTKTLEYMAAGKPVVSTAVPDVVRNFTPVVKIADSNDAFAEAVRQAYQNPDNALINQGIEIANNASWESIVAAMRERSLKTDRRDGDTVTTQ